MLIFALAVEYQDQVFCLRGNHESRAVSTIHGLKEECLKIYGKGEGLKIFNKVAETFPYLPIAAVVKNRYFCVHGGLSPYFKKVEELEKIDRQDIQSIEDEIEKGKGVDLNRLSQGQKILTDLLWSDCVEEEKQFEKSPRGAGHLFGKEVTKSFLHSNNLKMIIRSHQPKEYGHEYVHDDQCLTIFSCSNYDNLKNQGCVAVINTEKGKVSLHHFREEKKSFKKFICTFAKVGVGSGFSQHRGEEEEEHSEETEWSDE